MEQTFLFHTKHEYPTLYARAESGAILEWNIIVDGDSFFTVTGQQGGKKVTSKKTKCYSKNIGKANETTPEKQAIAEADSKWQKKIKEGYFEDITEIDNSLSFVFPMLAYPLYSERTKKIKDKVTGKVSHITETIDRTPYVKWPAMVDRKYNGMRQCTTSSGPFSRKGEPILSAPHIFESLRSLFQKYPNLYLDGELYNHEFRYKLNELIKIVRVTAKITDDLLEKSEQIVKYYVYDGYGFENIKEETPCIQRREALKLLLKKVPYIEVAPYHVANNMEEARNSYEEFVDDGYEGAIIRNSNAPYQHIRTSDLIKLKPFEDLEVIILEIIDPKTGNWGGSGKTALVRMQNGKTFVATFKGSYEMAQKILKNKDQWIGKKVTARYTGWTGKGTPNSAQIDPNNCDVGDR